MKQKRGFTLVEIILALAVATLMLIAFISTISYRIGKERYTDATRNFADFLRTIYSEVENVQNDRRGIISAQNQFCTLTGQYAYTQDPNLQPNPNDNQSYAGRSGCAVYGKLISFGETGSNGSFYVYDVIGKAVDFRSNLGGDVLDNLKHIYADVLALKANDNGTYTLGPAGNYYAYKPTWDAWPENPDKSKFEGEILIVRSPTTGAVNTYFSSRKIDYQQIISDYKNSQGSLNPAYVGQVYNAAASRGDILSSYLNSGNSDAFTPHEIDFCINSPDVFSHVSYRNNVRIKEYAHDSTAVEIIETDKPQGEGGNRC
ncbi:type II secretion system protein [Candidatus Saccharibacteria bacterium]|nr:type II secretion system protein [Candidatus Saccharibacteria bacterium]